MQTIQTILRIYTVPQNISPEFLFWNEGLLQWVSPGALADVHVSNYIDLNMKFSFQRSNVFSLHPDILYGGGAYCFRAAPSLRGSCSLLIAETILVPIVHILFQTLLCFTEQTCILHVLCKGAYPPLQRALRATQEQVTRVTASPSKTVRNEKTKGKRKSTG